MNHIELGQKGEDVAVNHLISKGYEIVERNYRFMKSEIDIICKKGKELIIVEVKTRQSVCAGQPYEAVNRTKQRQIIKVANNYIEVNNSKLDVRMDVISIIMNRFGTEIDHIRNAFYPC